MTRIVMQPKIYNLRLNLDQVHDTVDGWSENRKNIEEASLDLYDSQFSDIVAQLNSQGISIMIDLEEQEKGYPIEAYQANSIMRDLTKLALNATMERAEQDKLVTLLIKMNELLFDNPDGLGEPE